MVFETDILNERKFKKNGIKDFSAKRTVVCFSMLGVKAVILNHGIIILGPWCNVT